MIFSKRQSVRGVSEACVTSFINVLTTFSLVKKGKKSNSISGVLVMDRVCTQ